jgi:hypothetical protein
MVDAYPNRQVVALPGQRPDWRPARTYRVFAGDPGVRVLAISFIAGAVADAMKDGVNKG